jgi:DNA-binding MarR family transcriptional regulator
MPTLREEINKLRAFESPAVEAFLNLERTSALLHAQAQRLFRPHGLSPATYNILRILRGHAPDPARPNPRTCSQVKADMVTPVPDLTRLVERLGAAGLVARAACPGDARSVHLTITDAGRALLAALDRPVAELHAGQLGHLSERELRQLSRLLEKARSAPDQDRDKEQDPASP